MRETTNMHNTNKEDTDGY